MLANILSLGVCVYVLSHSVVSDSTTLCTVASQAPLSMNSPGKNTGVGCHFPPLGDLPDLGIKPPSPVSAAWQVDSLTTEPSRI